MKEERYSVYEAKARFSEIVRKVRSKRRIIITYRGKDVAEVVPFQRDSDELAERLERLEDEGIVTGPRGPVSSLRTLAEKPGALRRLFERRD